MVVFPVYAWLQCSRDHTPLLLNEPHVRQTDGLCGPVMVNSGKSGDRDAKVGVRAVQTTPDHSVRRRAFRLNAQRAGHGIETVAKTMMSRDIPCRLRGCPFVFFSIRRRFSHQPAARFLLKVRSSWCPAAGALFRRRSLGNRFSADDRVFHVFAILRLDVSRRQSWPPARRNVLIVGQPKRTAGVHILSNSRSAPRVGLQRDFGRSNAPGEERFRMRLARLGVRLSRLGQFGPPCHCAPVRSSWRCAGNGDCCCCAIRELHCTAWRVRPRPRAYLVEVNASLREALVW